MGIATALTMAEKGVSVVITGRDETRGASTVEKVRSGGHDAQFIAADFSQMSEVGRVANETGEIDVLVTCAGAHARAMAAWPMQNLADDRRRRIPLNDDLEHGLLNHAVRSFPGRARPDSSAKCSMQMDARRRITSAKSNAGAQVAALARNKDPDQMFSSD